LQLENCHKVRFGRAAIATLLVAMVLLLDAMAAAPALHEWFHADAGHEEHQCAVTLFAHGQVETASVDIPVLVPVTLVEISPRIEFSFFCSALENLPAGRAPPALLAVA
jgi:hypothetical protein